MTFRPPNQRISDILRQNSKATLERHAAELVSAAASLPPEATQTRFLRNCFLINPKSVRMMAIGNHHNSVEESLTRWGVFAFYKPPFCPMRREEGVDNYHKVSVESFVAAALRSRAIAPVLHRTLSPSEIRVRVLYNLATYASGPIVVSVSDRFDFTTSLVPFSMAYDVLVAGHLPKQGVQEIPTERLFPLSSTSSPGQETLQQQQQQRHRRCRCTYEVVENAYYAVHPVSLLHVKVVSPPTAKPPEIDAYVRDNLGTSVLGDPYGMDRVLAAPFHRLGDGKRTKDAASLGDATSTSPHSSSSSSTLPPITRAYFQASSSGHPLLQNAVGLQGDTDFPRVFTHLREVNVDAGYSASAPGATPYSFPSVAEGMGPGASTEDGDGEAGRPNVINYHCNKCFEPHISPTRLFSLRHQRLRLLDGAWMPESEFL